MKTSRSGPEMIIQYMISRNEISFPINKQECVLDYISIKNYDYTGDINNDSIDSFTPGKKINSY